MVYTYTVSKDVVPTLPTILNERGWHRLPHQQCDTGQLTVQQQRQINLNWQTYRIGLQHVGYHGSAQQSSNPRKRLAVNHFLHTQIVCKKDNLARQLQLHALLYDQQQNDAPAVASSSSSTCSTTTNTPPRATHRSANAARPPLFNFHPHTYLLPQDRLAVEDSIRRGIEHAGRRSKSPPVYILKPAAGRQGKDIRLLSTVDELPPAQCKDPYVIQHYITNPCLLIGNYKFDLRIYVLITRYHPLQVYLYDDGLVRFTSYPYEQGDYKNTYRHLTNFTLNKKNYSSVNSEKSIIGRGCKWTIHQLWQYLRSTYGIDHRPIWQKIQTLIIATVITSIDKVPQTDRSFELFGYDIMLDSDLQPWLLEVNASPALATTTWHDQQVKIPMLHSMLDAIGFTRAVTMGDSANTDDIPTPSHPSATIITAKTPTKKATIVKSADKRHSKLKVIRKASDLKSLRASTSPMAVSPAAATKKKFNFGASANRCTNAALEDQSTYGGVVVTDDFTHRQTSNSFGQFERIFPFNDKTSAASIGYAVSCSNKSQNDATAANAFKHAVVSELKQRLSKLQRTQTMPSTQSATADAPQLHSPPLECSSSTDSHDSNSTDEVSDTSPLLHSQLIHPSSVAA